MFAGYRIGYALMVDWEVPSHADSGPAEQGQPVAVPTGSGGAATGSAVPWAEAIAAADDYAALAESAGGLDEPDEADEPDGSADRHHGRAEALAEPDGQGEHAAEPDGQREHAAEQSGQREHAAEQSGQGEHAAEPDGQDSEAEPADSQRDWRSMFRERPAARPQRTGRTQARVPTVSPRRATELISRPIVSARRSADPRVRIWVARSAIAVVLYLGFMLWLDWRIALTIAVVFAAADTVFRSKTTAIVPPAVRVTAAQRSTRRRLKVLQSAGYLALHARTIPGKRPGTRSVIDHVVVGPAGVFVLDSEYWDRRLTVRTIGGKLYYGPENQEDRLKQSRWEAHQAAVAVSAELGRPIKVHPAMIVYGPRIPWGVTKLQGVNVFDGGRIGTYFRRQSKATASRHLSTSQIATVFAAATKALPPMQ